MLMFGWDFSWCLVEILKMKCDQDLCLNLWYDLKKLLWQDGLNPRVRCAFGNVFLCTFPLGSNVLMLNWDKCNTYYYREQHWQASISIILHQQQAFIDTYILCTVSQIGANRPFSEIREAAKANIWDTLTPWIRVHLHPYLLESNVSESAVYWNYDLS